MLPSLVFSAAQIARVIAQLSILSAACASVVALCWLGAVLSGANQ